MIPNIIAMFYRWTGYATVLVELLAFCPAALADAVPHHMSGPYVYYSTDMSLVEVWLGQVWYRTDDEFGIGAIDPKTTKFIPGEPVARVKIPRAYINVADPYSSNASHPALRYNVLPERIFSPQLTLSMTYPEELPYSVVYETWPKHKPDFSMPRMGIGVAGLQGVEKQTRAMLIVATIRAVASDARAPDRPFKPDQFMPRAGDYEGFSFHTNLPTNWQFYFDDGPDEIRRISCTASVEKSKPDFFCQYNVPLNSRLYAELTFLDFRFHGGREFARERIRAFKKFACPIFQCDEKALRAAEIRGSAK
jgi:hypothetical protein